MPFRACEGGSEQGGSVRDVGDDAGDVVGAAAFVGQADQLRDQFGGVGDAREGVAQGGFADRPLRPSEQSR